MEETFVHLHVHSHYSMMRGASSVQALCKAAAEAGFRHLALTDTNGFYGLVNFLEAAKNSGIRPIVGATVETETGKAVVLARTARGYELLSDLLSRRHLDENFHLVRAFPEAPEDLAVLSSDPGIVKALRSRAACRVEVVPGPSGRKALHVATALGIPPVATNAVYFAHPDDYPIHRLMRAIDLNRTLSSLPAEETVQPGQWLKPEAEMARHFPNAPEALANTGRLAGECLTAWDRFSTVFPSYRDCRDDHFAVLVDRCRQGIIRRYGRTEPAIEERLAEELDLIRSKGYVDYFLVVADIVGSRPIHCGRGSAAASLVSYLLGITHVDPVRHRLLFGRFLNPERKDHPDIDVDFPWDERDDLFDEVRHCHGPERMALVANHTGFAARAAVREVAKVYGIPAPEIREVTRRMSFWTHPEDLRHRIQNHPKFRGFPLDPPWPEIIDLASRLESLPRHLSTHCGGVILVPDRVSRYVPVQRNAKGDLIIQWEKDQAEAAGLVKIDLLGNRSLAVIRDTLAAIEENTGKAPDYAALNPVDDSATQDLLRRGDSMGVFYVESPAMRQLQQKTRRGDFEHLVIHSSIIRPAANRYIREYIRRLHGAPYEPLHPSIADLLAETYGILVYQEDVVQAAMILAGFSWGEADRLRKVISRKSREQLSQFRLRFSDGCAGRGIPRKVVDAIWEMFTSFSGYSFCKPHSASYALVSFKSAYLKVHHPAEFMAAVLSNGGGYYSTFAYISEARRMGITVLGPDVNESRWNYRGKGETIRMGLQQIRGIHRDTIDALLEERSRNSPFVSIDDILDRVNIPASDAAILARSGAMDSLAGNLNRPQLLWFLESRLRGGPFFRNEARTAQRILFPRSRMPFDVPPLPDLASHQKWRQEVDTLGFVLSVHPLTAIEPSLRKLRCPIVPASDLARHVGRRIRVLGWPITRKEVFTREGESMEFVSFEDRTAIYESVFFPGVFRRFCQDLDMNRAYLLLGDVESEFGTVSLTVRQLTRINERPGGISSGPPARRSSRSDPSIPLCASDGRGC